MENLVAGTTAALLTLFDLDRTFYVPSSARRKIPLYAWWLSFILANGALAALLYAILGDVDALRDMNVWLKAVVVGIGYLALVRLKFATFNYQGKDVPFGLEAFYDAGKGFIFKRINRIALEARRQEVENLVNTLSLEQLAQRARLQLANDGLLTAEEKRAGTEWLVRTLRDQSTDEAGKRLSLANFVSSGQMMIA
jgi:hypothetical protein